MWPGHSCRPGKGEAVGGDPFWSRMSKDSGGWAKGASSGGSMMRGADRHVSRLLIWAAGYKTIAADTQGCQLKKKILY